MKLPMHRRNLLISLAVLAGLAAVLVARGATQLPDDRSLSDEGDHYLSPEGEAVRLWRKTGEMVVLFENGVTETEGLELVNGAAGGELEAIGSCPAGDRGSVKVFRSKDGAPLDVERVADLRKITFAYPVYADPASRARMIPSDEVLVRIEGVMEESLRSEIDSAGMTVLRQTRATRMNVFVLRLKNPKQGDSLAVARKLAVVAGVRWTQPNFWREMKLEGLPETL